MSTAREEIMAEAAEMLAHLNPTMVNELTDVPGSPRTIWVGACRILTEEGIIHIVQRRGKTYAKFTSDDTYRQRWS